MRPSLGTGRDPYRYDHPGEQGPARARVVSLASSNHGRRQARTLPRARALVPAASDRCVRPDSACDSRPRPPRLPPAPPQRVSGRDGTRLAPFRPPALPVRVLSLPRRPRPRASLHTSSASRIGSRPDLKRIGATARGAGMPAPAQATGGRAVKAAATRLFAAACTGRSAGGGAGGAGAAVLVGGARGAEALGDVHVLDLGAWRWAAVRAAGIPALFGHLAAACFLPGPAPPP